MATAAGTVRGSGKGARRIKGAVGQVVNRLRGQQAKRAEQTAKAPEKAKPKRVSKLKQTENNLGHATHHLTLIRKKELELDRCYEEFTALRKQAISAKKEYDRAVIELRSFIRNGPERLPLYDGLTEDLKPGVPAATSAPATTPTASKVDPEAWRSVKLADVGLSAADVQRFEDHKVTIKTLGDLTDWQLKGGDVTKVKGIGIEKGTKIADQIADWWSKHPEYCRKPAAAQAAPTKSDGEKPANGNGSTQPAASTKTAKSN